MYRIYRVHKHLRDVNKKAYEPEIIAIGPYHRGKESLKMMEEHKKRYLDLLLGRNGQSLEMYISAVRDLERNARNFYTEPISLCPDKLIKMLVLDGCFIIELLRKFDNRASRHGDPRASRHGDPIFQMEWIMNSLQRDLLLFENQIPFFVLRKLFGLIEERGQHERLIQLVLKFWKNVIPGGECIRNMNMDNKKGKYHLLDLVHQYYRPLRAAAGNCYLDVDKDAIMKEQSLIIPSATELKNANVEFWKRKKCCIVEFCKKKSCNMEFREEQSYTLFDVEFKEGKMLMQPLTIEDRTECFFRNLIVYEHYNLDAQPNYVTDYARLLNCLIDCPADVEILSQCGIINNLLGDNKAVAKFVNGLTETISCPSGHFIYAHTFKSVNAYCQKTCSRTCASLKRDYCYSPWATLGVAAASVILILTIIQTVFQVLSSPKSLLGSPK